MTACRPCAEPDPGATSPGSASFRDAPPSPGPDRQTPGRRTGRRQAPRRNPGFSPGDLSRHAAGLRFTRLSARTCRRHAVERGLGRLPPTPSARQPGSQATARRSGGVPATGSEVPTPLLSPSSRRSAWLPPTPTTRRNSPPVRVRSAGGQPLSAHLLYPSRDAPLPASSPGTDAAPIPGATPARAAARPRTRSQRSARRSRLPRAPAVAAEQRRRVVAFDLPGSLPRFGTGQEYPTLSRGTSFTWKAGVRCNRSAKQPSSRRRLWPAHRLQEPLGTPTAPSTTRPTPTPGRPPLHHGTSTAASRQGSLAAISLPNQEKRS